MKKILLFNVIILLSNFGLKGWFPGWTDNPKSKTI